MVHLVTYKVNFKHGYVFVFSLLDLSNPVKAND